jgi:hypothetical protein
MVPFPTNPSDGDLRWFGGLGMLFLWGIAAWLSIRFDAGIWATTVAAVGLAAGIVAYVNPRRLKWVYLGWMAAVFPIGWVVGHLLLGIVYYGVLTPVGCLLRLTGHDSLQRRPDLNATTFWRPRNRERKPADYFRQY